ncbi:MAG: IS5/IS1182 family transposase, partial [Desulfobulbus sp.]|nr:IS5/IS1182 family transposase [Desulfobulbus sp.]
MRGLDIRQQKLFTFVSPESRVSRDHSLRPILILANKALKDFSPVFQELYSTVGRPSIPPEQLLRSLLLRILHSIRSER